MIPMGSIGPGPTRDPNDPDQENETVFQAFGWEIGVALTAFMVVFLLLGFSMYADKKDKDLRLQEIPQQVQGMEQK